MITSLSSDDRVKNSFDAIVYSLSNPEQDKNNIGYYMNDEKIYKACKNFAAQKSPDSNVLDILKVSHLLLGMSKDFENDYSKVIEFHNDYHQGKLNIRTSVAEKEYNNLLNNTLVNLCSSLSDVGFIDFLIESHNKKCIQNYVSFLSVTPEQMEDEFNRNKHCDIFSSYAKIAFWANKFIKLLNSAEGSSLFHYNTAFINKSDIDDKNVSSLLYTSDCIKTFLASIYYNSPSPECEKAYLDKYREDYSKVLEGVIGSAANIDTAYKFLALFENSKSIIYSVKDQFTNTLITDCLVEHNKHKASPFIKNWGITKDKKDTSKYIFSIHTRNSLFPCSFHQPQDSLFDTMRALGISKIDIPEYDQFKYFATFSASGKPFPVNILCPPTERQKKEIKKLAMNKKSCAPIISTLNTHLNGGTYISHQNSMHIELDK